MSKMKNLCKLLLFFTVLHSTCALFSKYPPQKTKCTVSCEDFRKLEEKINLVFGRINAATNCMTYTFRVTPAAGNYDEARVMCLEMGGDLIQGGFAEDAHLYHNEARMELSRSGHKQVWVGIHSREKRGQWRYLNGAIFDGEYHHSRFLLYYWTSKHPHDFDGDDLCACVSRPMNGLMDVSCDLSLHGLCEFRKQTCV